MMQWSCSGVGGARDAAATGCSGSGTAHYAVVAQRRRRRARLLHGVGGHDAEDDRYAGVRRRAEHAARGRADDRIKVRRRTAHLPRQWTASVEASKLLKILHSTVALVLGGSASCGAGWGTWRHGRLPEPTRMQNSCTVLYQAHHTVRPAVPGRVSGTQLGFASTSAVRFLRFSASGGGGRARGRTTAPTVITASYLPLLAMLLATTASSKLPGTHATCICRLTHLKASSSAPHPPCENSSDAVLCCTARPVTVNLAAPKTVCACHFPQCFHSEEQAPVAKGAARRPPRAACRAARSPPARPPAAAW